MGSCSTKIKLSDDDKHMLELSIDNENFTSNLILCNNKTNSKRDRLYLQELAFKHLERIQNKKI